MFCHRCGQKNPSTAKFCKECGTELKVLEEETEVLQDEDAGITEEIDASAPLEESTEPDEEVLEVCDLVETKEEEAFQPSEPLEEQNLHDVTEEKNDNKYFNFRFDDRLDLSVSGFMDTLTDLLPLSLTKIFSIVFYAALLVSVGYAAFLYLSWVISGGYQSSTSTVSNSVEGLVHFDTNVWRVTDFNAFSTSPARMISIGLCVILLVISTIKFVKVVDKTRGIVVITLIASIPLIILVMIAMLVGSPQGAGLGNVTAMSFLLFVVIVALLVVTYRTKESKAYYKASIIALLLSVIAVPFLILVLENIVQMIAFVGIIALVVFIFWIWFSGSSSGSSSGAQGSKKGNGDAKESEKKNKGKKHDKKGKDEEEKDCAYVRALNTGFFGNELWIMDTLDRYPTSIYNAPSGSYAGVFICTLADFESGKFKIYRTENKQRVTRAELKDKRN